MQAKHRKVLKSYLIESRYILGWEKLYQMLRYMYFLVYLLGALLPLGLVGYHLMPLATKEEEPPPAAQS